MSFVTERLLAGRRQKVGESVRGRLLDIGFGTGLSLNLIIGRAPGGASLS